MRKAFLLFLASCAVAMAAPQNFLLGLNYAELIPTGAGDGVNAVYTGTDAEGNIYILLESSIATSSIPYTDYLIKLSPGGDRVIYSNQLAFPAYAPMAVDPTGNVYLTLIPPASIPPNATPGPSIQKIGADGKTVEYSTSLGQNVVITGLAADANGRAYVGGYAVGNGLATTPNAYQQTPASTANNSSNAFVARLTPTGAVDYATYLGGSGQGQVNAIAVDAAGSAFVAGMASSALFTTTPGAYVTAGAIPNFSSAGFVARLSPNGSALVYSTFTDAHVFTSPIIALDSADDASVALQNAAGTLALVEQLNPEGSALGFAYAMPGAPAGIAVDANGNTYVDFNTEPNFRVKNSLATCAAGLGLTVFDPEGNILQSTYLPQSSGGGAFGLGANASPYVVGGPSSNFAPTRQFGNSGSLLFLNSLAQNPNAATIQLACEANAASYDGSAISGGEIVSLFGQTIGPLTGAGAQVSDLEFPKQLGGVQVTFNGTPGALLYAQDGQVNAIAPWALQNQGGTTVDICVIYNGSTSNCLTVPTGIIHPGVFTVDGSYAAALNQDGTLNTAANPAQPGSTVSVFATGLGPISPAADDGAIVGTPLPVDTLPDYVYWVECPGIFGCVAQELTLKYAGPAPFGVAGLSQINFVVESTFVENFGTAPYILQADGIASMGGLFVPPGSNGFFVHVAGVPEPAILPSRATRR